MTTPIEPARYDGARAARTYQPAFPWGRIALVLAIIAALVAVYLWRQHQRVRAIVGEINAIRAESVVPVLSDLRSAREAAEALALDDKLHDGSVRAIEAGFNLDVLREATVEYAVLNQKDIALATSLVSGPRTPDDNSFSACLGVPLVPVHEIEAVPVVLTEAWLAEAEPTSDPFRWSIRKGQIERAVRVELPKVKQRLPIRYFVLFAVQGVDRVRDPIDVHVWRLSDRKKVVQFRAEPIGSLITVRNMYSDSNAAGPKPQELIDDPVAVADCAVVRELRARVAEANQVLPTGEANPR